MLGKLLKNGSTTADLRESSTCLEELISGPISAAAFLKSLRKGFESRFAMEFESTAVSEDMIRSLKQRATAFELMPGSADTGALLAEKAVDNKWP